MKNKTLALAVACASLVARAETNGAALAASKVQTFQLQYASAAEVACQINSLMSREVDPEDVKGTTGAPVSSAAAKKYPEGINAR